jgi:predicted RNA-binding protein YlqC (UPF0109 family)
MLKDFLQELVREVVDHPEEVMVKELDGENVCVFELHVRKEDLGKVIGRHGQTVQALRTLLTAVAAKSGKRAVLEINE